MTDRLNQIKKYHLQQKVAVYVPSTRDADIPLTKQEQQHYIDAIAKLLSLAFGGATAVSACGYWVDEETEALIAEAPVIVYAYATEADLNKHLDAVIDWALNMKQELKQQGISIEVNNQLYII